MPVIERKIRVTYRHQVHFTHGVFDPANPLLKTVLVNDEHDRIHRALVVVDQGLAQTEPTLSARMQAYFDAFPEALHLVCPPHLIPAGERLKNSHLHLSEILALVNQFHLDRQSYLLAVGGGALLDMVGLAAALAHRGLRHVRLPTTTLSQDDSGVGVKNGINAFGKKNFIGTFAPPFAVINDLDLLASLSPRDKRAGFVEAVKVALIRDAAFFSAIEQDAAKLAAFEPESVERLIYRCAELHVHHIATSGDPFEFGSARPLDFGHWAAHKLEQLSAFSLRHGEAVAIGIALDVVYSHQAGLLRAAEVERILTLLETLGFDLFADELLQSDVSGRPVVLQGLEEFREHLGGKLTVTLLDRIGHGTEVHHMDEALVLEAIRQLHHRRDACSAQEGQ